MICETKKVVNAHIEPRTAHLHPDLERRQRRGRTAKNFGWLPGAQLHVVLIPGTGPELHRCGVGLPACVWRGRCDPSG